MVHKFRLLNFFIKFKVKLFNCPACGLSLLLKLGDIETTIRCIRCRGTAIHLSLLDTINELVKNSDSKHVYELSSRGAVVTYLKRSFNTLETSEYYSSTTPGMTNNGIRCEDVQKLSYSNKSFDLLTCTEVFEHVPDDLAGFKEVRRVLQDGGFFIFTVPLSDNTNTIERASLLNTKIEYILPAQYHHDKISGRNKVLVYRDYGADITERLLAAGFSKAWIHKPRATYFSFSRNVIIAKA